jgi:hypothetical protein
MLCDLLQVACLGVGGGSLPTFLSAHMPNALIHAVDINPLVLSCASQHMGLPVSAEVPTLLAAKFSLGLCLPALHQLVVIVQT